MLELARARCSAPGLDQRGAADSDLAARPNNIAAEVWNGSPGGDRVVIASLALPARRQARRTSGFTDRFVYAALRPTEHRRQQRLRIGPP